MSARPSIGVTGGHGTVGTELRSVWPDVDWKCFEGDVREQREVDAWIQGGREWSAVIHLAAVVPTHVIEENPFEAHRANVLGTLHVLESLRHMDAPPWLFFASTSHVYKSDSSALREEGSVLEPATLYGRTKLQAEEWIRAYQRRYGLQCCVARIFSFSGPTQGPSYFVPSMVRRIREAPQQATLEIGGLQGTRDFSSVREVAQAIREFATRQPVGVFNLGSGVPTVLADVVAEVQLRLNRPDVVIRNVGADMAHLVADVARMNEIGIRLTSDLGRTIQQIVDGSAALPSKPKE